MNGKDVYLLTEDEFMKIQDLMEGLNLAIEKIIIGRRFMWDGREEDHPAVTGYLQQLKNLEMGIETDYSKIF